MTDRVLTCKRCGQTKRIPKGRVCAACYSAEPKHRDQQAACHKESQQRTVEAGAVNNGNEWTHADDLVVLDESLTLVERALRLKRTYYAVACRHNAITTEESS